MCKTTMTQNLEWPIAIHIYIYIMNMSLIMMNNDEYIISVSNRIKDIYHQVTKKVWCQRCQPQIQYIQWLTKWCQPRVASSFRWDPAVTGLIRRNSHRGWVQNCRPGQSYRSWALDFVLGPGNCPMFVFGMVFDHSLDFLGEASIFDD